MKAISLVVFATIMVQKTDGFHHIWRKETFVKHVPAFVAAAAAALIGSASSVHAQQLQAVALAPSDTVSRPAVAPVVVKPVQAVEQPAAVDLSASSDSSLAFEALVTRVDPGGNTISVIGDDDRVYKAQIQATEIILPGASHDGTISDLSRGMHIRLIGTRTGTDRVLADRIRVLSGSAQPAVSAPSPATGVTTVAAITLPVAAMASVPVAVASPPVDLSTCTGVVIDASAFEKIFRSPAPAIYGPDMTLLYPDRSHVPSADDVQTESVVRYYRTLDTAQQGVGGDKPLVLAAQSIAGCASDSIVLTADEAAEFKALDARLHFTQTWKVGFLVPADR
jgi:hypothetical protein